MTMHKIRDEKPVVEDEYTITWHLETGGELIRLMGTDDIGTKCVLSINRESGLFRHNCIGLKGLWIGSQGKIVLRED